MVDVVRQSGAAHGAAGPIGVTPQPNRSASAGRDGLHHGGDILELSLDGVANCVAAGAEPSAVHREGGHAVSQLVNQRVEGGVVDQRTVDQDERRPTAIDPDGERGPVGRSNVESSWSASVAVPRLMVSSSAVSGEPASEPIGGCQT